jgi:hypothetical protein
MSSGNAGDLGPRLRGAGPDELARVLEIHLEELSPDTVSLLLRNPHVTDRIIERLLSQRRLLVHHRVRLELAAHPKTPEVHALRFVGGLFWRGLLAISGDPRARPRIRRAAERHLLNRIPGLAAGERMAIARRAGPLLVSQLRLDPEPKVVEALLENPRLTEGALMPLVTADQARPEILTLVARDRKWGARYPIRLALCRNRQTPVTVTLGLLPLLRKVDLAPIEQDRRLPLAVRRRAAVLLGRTPA